MPAKGLRSSLLITAYERRSAPWFAGNRSAAAGVQRAELRLTTCAQSLPEVDTACAPKPTVLRRSREAIGRAAAGHPR